LIRALYLPKREGMGVAESVGEGCFE